MSHSYNFVGAQDKSLLEKQVVMVHDVDHKIEFCEKFSKIEKSVGIKSTYFLRLHAQNYNMLSFSSIKNAEDILKNGHEIGLHYEPGFIKSGDYESHIKEEMNILSKILDYEVTTFNIHEPARTGVDLGQVLESKNRCYNSDFFKSFKYLSDSSCRWREGCFSEHVNKWDKLLVLTHPFWWYHETPAENY